MAHSETNLFVLPTVAKLFGRHTQNICGFLIKAAVEVIADLIYRLRYRRTIF